MSIRMSLFALVACSLAALSVAAPAPGLATFPLSAPILAPVAAPGPVVTAYSSQYVARNYNGIAYAPAAAVAAPVVGYPIYAPQYAAPGPLVEEYLFRAQPDIIELGPGHRDF